MYSSPITLATWPNRAQTGPKQLKLTLQQTTQELMTKLTSCSLSWEKGWNLDLCSQTDCCKEMWYIFIQYHAQGFLLNFLRTQKHVTGVSCMAYSKLSAMSLWPGHWCFRPGSACQQPHFCLLTLVWQVESPLLLNNSQVGTHAIFPSRCSKGLLPRQLVTTSSWEVTRIDTIGNHRPSTRRRPQSCIASWRHLGHLETRHEFDVTTVIVTPPFWKTCSTNNHFKISMIWISSRISTYPSHQSSLSSSKSWSWEPVRSIQPKKCRTVALWKVMKVHVATDGPYLFSAIAESSAPQMSIWIDLF